MTIGWLVLFVLGVALAIELALMAWARRPRPRGSAERGAPPSPEGSRLGF